MELKAREEVINKDYLFQKIDYYDVYRYYIGNFSVGQPISSPFRKDNNPSFSIYIKDGKLRHHDFGDDRYKGDCIDLVKQLFNLDTKEAILKIAKDFGISEGVDNSARITSTYTKPYISEKASHLIQISARRWSAEDIAYWKQFGITTTMLREDNVYPVKEAYLNKRRIGMWKDELVYAYQYDEGIKLYFPNREKKEKWKSNIPLTVVENQKVLENAKRVIITKAKKDRLVLSRYMDNVLNVQNETRACFTPEFVKKLEGKEVWINYDSDDVGVKNCTAITKEFGFKYVNVPREYLPVKDFSDLYKEHGEKVLLQVLKSKNLI